MPNKILQSCGRPWTFSGKSPGGELKVEAAQDSAAAQLRFYLPKLGSYLRVKLAATHHFYAAY
jgi:hypothetical protein